MSVLTSHVCLIIKFEAKMNPDIEDDDDQGSTPSTPKTPQA
jgi:hypothetical protein